MPANSLTRLANVLAPMCTTFITSLLVRSKPMHQAHTGLISRSRSDILTLRMEGNPTFGDAFIEFVQERSKFHDIHILECGLCIVSKEAPLASAHPFSPDRRRRTMDVRRDE